MDPSYPPYSWDEGMWNMFLVFILLKHRPAVWWTSTLTKQKQIFFFKVFNNNEVGKVKQYECSISVNNFFSFEEKTQEREGMCETYPPSPPIVIGLNPVQSQKNIDWGKYFKTQIIYIFISCNKTKLLKY